MSTREKIDDAINTRIALAKNPLYRPSRASLALLESFNEARRRAQDKNYITKKLNS